MAQTDPISTAALNSIGRQIAEATELTSDKRLLSERLGSESPSLTLTRTVSLWGIKPEALAALREGADPSQLEDWARPLERWHHQLRLNPDGASAFARSKASQTDPDEVNFGRLSLSSRAQKIEAAIERVEGELQNDPAKYGLPSPYDPLVRLLEIPFPRVTALMLLDEPHDDLHILVVAAPSGRGATLEPGALLDPVEFLRRLAAEPAPGGII